MKLNRLIAWAIYDTRITQNMTQQELAAKAGVHRTTISRAENGELHNLGTAEAILDALGINSFAQIIKSVDTEPKEGPVDKLPDEEQKTRQTGAQSLTGASEDEWVPLKLRPMTEEELQARSGYDLECDITEIYDCLLPDDGQEVLVTDGRHVTTDTFYWDEGEGCYFENSDDWMAWMPLPEPYREVACDGKR